MKNERRTYSCTLLRAGRGVFRAMYAWRYYLRGVDRVAAWLIAAIAVVYLAVGIDLMIAGKMGLGIAFLGYSFSNVGLYLAARA
jgi:hypothetical protein